MKNDPGSSKTASPTADSEKFDPFADRTSRDLRNGLSVAFARALDTGRPDGYHQVARRWRACTLSAGCRHYLENRLALYDRVMAAWTARLDSSPTAAALELWNLGLFFEVHEVVERVWRVARGGRREALKGLVQAAGVYVHLEAARPESAARLAARAAQRLDRWRKNLPEISNLGELLEALAAHPAVPCRLAAAGGGPSATLHPRGPQSKPEYPPQA